jgi:hypothetical protein
MDRLQIQIVRGSDDAWLIAHYGSWSWDVKEMKWEMKEVKPSDIRPIEIEEEDVKGHGCKIYLARAGTVAPSGGREQALANVPCLHVPSRMLCRDYKRVEKDLFRFE